jgi:hypothetical protein
MGKMLAYCGEDCSECGAYKAMKNNDQALREKTAAEWKIAYDFDFTPDMINCVSCKGNGIQIGHCLQCEIRKCAAGKNVINCGACTEFKNCKTINDFLKQVPALMDNLADQYQKRK